MLITVEGLDGAGTTTLVETMSERYPNAITTKEPSSGEIGQIVRRRLSEEESNGLMDFYLFMADRLDHIDKKIKPADEDGRLVISDRYADSTRAYQPVALTNAGYFDTQEEAKGFIHNTMEPWNYEPDLTIYIDISVDTALERAAGDEKYEKREFLEQVKDNYDDIADVYSRVVRVDGEQSIDAVATSALGKLDVVPPDRL